MSVLENVADRLPSIDAERIGALGADLRADHDIEQAPQQRYEDPSGAEFHGSAEGRQSYTRYRAGM